MPPTGAPGWHALVRAPGHQAGVGCAKLRPGVSLALSRGVGVDAYTFARRASPSCRPNRRHNNGYPLHACCDGGLSRGTPGRWKDTCDDEPTRARGASNIPRKHAVKAPNAPRAALILATSSRECFFKARDGVSAVSCAKLLLELSVRNKEVFNLLSSEHCKRLTLNIFPSA